MGFTAVNTFVGFAKKAKVAFNLLDKPECRPLLFFAGMTANRTGQTELCHFAISVRDLIISRFCGHLFFWHFLPPSDCFSCALIRYCLFTMGVYQYGLCVSK